jgi:hypothetical protein
VTRATTAAATGPTSNVAARRAATPHPIRAQVRVGGLLRAAAPPRSARRSESAAYCWIFKAWRLEAVEGAPGKIRPPEANAKRERKRLSLTGARGPAEGWPSAGHVTRMPDLGVRTRSGPGARPRCFEQSFTTSRIPALLKNGPPYPNVGVSTPLHTHFAFPRRRAASRAAPRRRAPRDRSRGDPRCPAFRCGRRSKLGARAVRAPLGRRVRLRERVLPAVPVRYWRSVVIGLAVDWFSDRPQIAPPTSAVRSVCNQLVALLERRSS